MSKGDLRKAANLATNTMTKLRRDQEALLGVLEHICEILKIDYADVLTHIPDSKDKKYKTSYVRLLGR